MPATAELANLPEDSESLQALVRTLLLERNQEKQRANDLHLQALRQQQRVDELHLENLRLQKELFQLKKLYCGPRADRLQSEQELAQALLDFALQREKQPIHPDDLPPTTQTESEPEYELRKVKKGKGRRALANFDHLPTITHVHELKPEERACPCCGKQRQEIGAEESWQIEHIPGRFERLHHVRKKYACLQCEQQGENPQIHVAAKPETAIDKGLAGPGLLAYIVTSKFADYRVPRTYQQQWRCGTV